MTHLAEVAVLPLLDGFEDSVQKVLVGEWHHRPGPWALCALVHCVICGPKALTEVAANVGRPNLVRSERILGIFCDQVDIFLEEKLDQLTRSNRVDLLGITCGVEVQVKFLPDCAFQGTC